MEITRLQIWLRNFRSFADVHFPRRSELMTAQAQKNQQ